MKCSLPLCFGCDSVTGGSQPFCTFFCAFCFTEIRVVSQQNRTLTLACCFFVVCCFLCFFCFFCVFVVVFWVFVVVLVFLVAAQNSKLLNSRTGFRNLPTSVWCLLFGLFVVFVFENCFTAEGDFGTCLLVFGHKAAADIFALLEIGRSQRERKEKRGKALKAAQTSQPQAQQTGDV